MLRKFGKIAYFIGTGFLITALIFNFIPAKAVLADAEIKVHICHYDSGQKEYSTRYISANSVISGHGAHTGDIWPEFTLDDGTVVPAQGDQAILANDCKLPSAASVGYSIGTCVWTQAAGSLTPVTVTIVGATLHTGSVAGDITASQTLNLAPGSYTWPWEAIAPAYTGSGSLSFIIGDCTPPPLPFASASVLAGQCNWSAELGAYANVTVTIDHAVVHTGDVAGDITATQSGNVVPGTYNWPWEALEGYQGNGTLSFTVDDCTPPFGSGGVEVGACTLDGLKKTVTVTLSNATGQITGAGGPYNFSSTGGSVDLAPGSYTFSWTAIAGYQSSGSTPFTVDACASGSGSYEVGACNVDGSKKLVTVTLSNATGQITGAGGPYDFTGTGGSVELAPGSYNFSWTALPGYQGSGSIDFTVDACPASIGSVEVGACTVDGLKKLVTVYLTNATGQITGAGGPYNFTGAGGTLDLAPGAYTFTWTGIAGYQGSGTIPFTVEECPSGAADYVIGACSWNVETGSERLVTVNLTNATVTITGPTPDTTVYSFPGAENPLSLKPGTYSFAWAGAEGYKGSGTGEIVIDECPAGLASVDPEGECTWSEQDGSITPLVVILDHATATITGPSPETTAYNFPGAANPLGLGPGTYTFDWIADAGYQGSGTEQYTLGECVPLGKLGLTAICANDAANYNGWKVINPNAVVMPFEFSGAGGISGTGSVPANSELEFATLRQSGSDDMTLYSGGELQAYAKANSGCVEGPVYDPGTPNTPIIPVTGPTILIPVTGLDTGMVRRVLPGTLMSFGFGFLGIGLVFSGIARRKKE